MAETSPDGSAWRGKCFSSLPAYLPHSSSVTHMSGVCHPPRTQPGDQLTKHQETKLINQNSPGAGGALSTVPAPKSTLLRALLQEASTFFT